jgi:hypothetical protein
MAALKGVVLPVRSITLKPHPYYTRFSGRKPCPICTCDGCAFLASYPPWRHRISRPYLKRDKPRVISLAPNPQSTSLRQSSTTTAQHQLQQVPTQHQLQQVPTRHPQQASAPRDLRRHPGPNDYLERASPRMTYGSTKHLGPPVLTATWQERLHTARGHAVVQSGRIHAIRPS